MGLGRVWSIVFLVTLLVTLFHVGIRPLVIHSVAKDSIESPHYRSLSSTGILRENDAVHVSSLLGHDHHPVCAEIPARSPSFLWNNFVQNTKQLHAYELRRGIRSRPRLWYWRQFLDLLVKRRKAGEDLHFLWLTSDETDDHETMREDVDPRLLLDALEQWAKMFTVETSRDSTAIRFKVSTFTVSHMSPILWPDIQASLPPDFPPVDVILDATSMSATRKEVPQPHEMENSVSLTEMSPIFEDDLRRIQQDWIRSILLLDRSSCGNSGHGGAEKSQASPPLLILLDVSSSGKAAWQDLARTRVTQQLADWYQLPCLSATSIYESRLYREQVLLRREEIVSSLLQFALLDFTIDFCQQQADAKESPLLRSEKVSFLSEYVVPPQLDLGLSLQTISQEWNAAAAAANGKCV